MTTEAANRRRAWPDGNPKGWRRGQVALSLEARFRGQALRGDAGLVAEQAALSFGGLLRQLRAGTLLSQEELAEAAQLSRRLVSDLERGINRTARRDTALLLADALGLAEPVRSLFVAAALGRAPAAEVLAALQGEAAVSEGRRLAGGPAWPGRPYLGLVPFQERTRGFFTGAASRWPSWCSGWPGGWTGRGCCWWPGSQGRASPRCCTRG